MVSLSQRVQVVLHAARVRIEGQHKTIDTVRAANRDLQVR
jgi:hypothetical protein